HRDARVRRSPRPLPRRAAAVSPAQGPIDRAVRGRWRLAGVVAQPLAGPAAAVRPPGSGAALEGPMTAPAIPLVDLVAQHRDLEDELVAAFRRALATAELVGGAEVSGFEAEFAAFVGAAGCVGVGSGTDALRFAYQALGVRAGDEVITVPNTFIATTAALTQAGATIRF